MITWQQIRELVQAAYAVERDEPTWLGLVIPGAPETRIRVLLVSAAGALHLRVAADLGDEAALSHRQALLCNRALVTGALALEPAGRYILCCQRPLARLTADDVSALVDGVIREVALVAIARRRDAAPTDPLALAMYAD